MDYGKKTHRHSSRSQGPGHQSPGAEGRGGENTGWLHQDAWFSTLDLDKGHDVEYRMHTPGNGAYVFVIEGLAEVDGEVLGRRDGMGVWDTDGFGIRASADAQVLVIEVPMR